MNPDLVRYLSSVMRGDVKHQLNANMNAPQSESDHQPEDLVKDRFLVDSTFSLGLDEVV